jgi:hypothetical protein
VDGFLAMVERAVRPAHLRSRKLGTTTG